MNQFKVGDVVRCINNESIQGLVTKDKEYVVQDLNTGDDSVISLMTEQGFRMFLLSNRFVPIDEMVLPTLECAHSYKLYQGLTQSFEYCIYCDQKRSA